MDGKERRNSTRSARDFSKKHRLCSNIAILLQLCSFLHSSSRPLFQSLIMNPKFFVALFSVLLAAEDGRASASQMDDCRPQRCGNVSISYPFWMYGKQPDFCGYPPFNINCISGKGNKTETPILSILGHDLLVKNIFYDNRSIHLVSPDYEKSCRLPYINMSSGIYPFSLSSSNKQIYFLYNCTSPEGALVYRNTSCVFFDGPVYFGGEYSQPGGLNLSDPTCQIVLAPVMGYNELSVDGNYTDWLMSGWLLDWSAPDCADCLDSGGQCGYNTSTSNFMCMCRDLIHSHSCGPQGSNGSSKRNIIIIVSALAGFLLCLLIFFLVCCKPKKARNTLFRQKNDKCVETFLKKHGSLTPKRYMYSEIKRMTQSFSHKIGQGGYGTVFRGTLKDGHPVAVKILSESKGNVEEFINEVDSISRTSHVNIVSLLGFCLEGSKRVLIYEFMPNGSLEKFIYAEKSEARSPELGLRESYDIAIGIARGLEYLHQGCNTRIVHFDIKPHNILLDKDFCPKISDFGLAKLCLRKESVLSMEVPRGTFGYIAPEVFSRNFGAVSSKSDVYSYGMMVLEMVGAKKDFDAAAKINNTSEIYFPQWIYDHLDDRLDASNGASIAIACLSGENEEIARKMIIIGLWCIQTLSANRPSMRMVVSMLEGNCEDLRMPSNPHPW